MNDVRNLLNTNFLKRSFQDLLRIANVASAPRKTIKKLEYYQWLVNRQDLEFQTQLKKLKLDLRDFTTSIIQEL